MHIIIGILSFILNIMPGMLTTLLRLLGVGLITYIGLDYLSEQAFDLILDRYNGLPVHVLQILDLAGVHSAIMILISTMTAITAWKMKNAFVNKLRLKKGSILKA